MRVYECVAGEWVGGMKNEHCSKSFFFRDDNEFAYGLTNTNRLTIETFPEHVPIIRSFSASLRSRHFHFPSRLSFNHARPYYVNFIHSQPVVFR